MTQNRSFVAMDTMMQLTLPSGQGDAMEASEQLVKRLDGVCSRFGDGELAALNKAAGTPTVVSDELFALIENSGHYCTMTGNAFNPLLGKLMDVWGFSGSDDGLPRVAPAEEQLSSLLACADPALCEIDIAQSSVTLPDGAALDLGGLVKGYASDRVLALWRERGLTSGLVSLGGNVAALGGRPDGTPWTVGIRDPLSGDGLIGVLPVRDLSVVTSGGYERYREIDGQTYGHILNPNTGCPAESDLLSVTIICPSGELADALSTALFVMGAKEAQTFWRDHPELSFECVLVTEDRRVLTSPGLQGFEPEPGDYEVVGGAW